MGTVDPEVTEAILEYYRLPAPAPEPYAGWESSEGMSHAEIVARIANDPGRRAKAAADPEAIRRDELLRSGAGGLLPALAELGLPVATIDDLYQLAFRGKRIDYRVAGPLLVEWLPRLTYLPVVESIVRALSVAWAKRLARPLFLEMFRELPPLDVPDFYPDPASNVESFHWVIGYGLGKWADPSVADDHLELALDRSYGGARLEIVSTLPKVKDERTPGVLLSLLDDPTVRLMAVRALGKLRYGDAREVLVDLGEPLEELGRRRDTRQAVLLSEVKLALKRLDQAT